MIIVRYHQDYHSQPPQLLSTTTPATNLSVSPPLLQSTTPFINHHNSKGTTINYHTSNQQPFKLQQHQDNHINNHNARQPQLKSTTSHLVIPPQHQTPQHQSPHQPPQHQGDQPQHPTTTAPINHNFHSQPAHHSTTTIRKSHQPPQRQISQLQSTTTSTTNLNQSSRKPATMFKRIKNKLHGDRSVTFKESEMPTRAAQREAEKESEVNKNDPAASSSASNGEPSTRNHYTWPSVYASGGGKRRSVSESFLRPC